VFSRHMESACIMCTDGLTISTTVISPPDRAFQLKEIVDSLIAHSIE
jgi:hypothetical protein